jgi:predicted TIM-barrel fold metal-dependent hydrolase
MANRKIVDAHHHLWNLGRGYNYPWLQDKLSGDGMLSNLATIACDYLLPEYRADTSNHDVVGSAHIEAVPANPVIEIRWLQETTKSEGLPSAIVALVELQKTDAEKATAEQVTFQNVRGIRQNVNWRQNPRYTFTDHDFLTDEAWHAGFSLLCKYELSFDLQLYPGQTADAVELARRNPETLIVVNHAGMRLERDETSLDLWRDGLKRLGAEPNVVAKISGLGMVDWRWSEASIRPFVLGVIDRFGVDRVMFGSNFPVDKLYSSFDTLYGSFESIVASISESEKDQLFRNDALRHYRLRADA